MVVAWHSWRLNYLKCGQLLWESMLPRDQFKLSIRFSGREIRKPEVESWFCRYLAVWPPASCIQSLGLGSLTFEVKGLDWKLSKFLRLFHSAIWDGYHSIRLETPFWIPSLLLTCYDLELGSQLCWASVYSAVKRVGWTRVFSRSFLTLTF